MTNCSEKVRWKLSFLCVKLLQSDHLICSWESYLTCKCVFLSTFLQCLSCNQKFVKKQIPWGLYFLTKVYRRRDQNKTFRAIQGRPSIRYLIKIALLPLVVAAEPEKLCSSRKTKNKKQTSVIMHNVISKNKCRHVSP